MRRILLLLLCAPCCAVYAQQGVWEGSVLCERCQEPVAMDFADGNNGLLVTKSTKIQNVITTFTFRTNDGGNSWLMLSDTSSVGFSTNFNLTMRYFFPHFAVHVGGGLEFTVDTGRHWQSFSAASSIYGALITSQSTSFHFVNNSSSCYFLVTRDTGKFFDFYSDITTFPEQILETPCIIDSMETWIVAGGQKNDRLFYTINGAGTWNESYPLDSSLYGTVWLGVPLQGAKRGTIYLYTNPFVGYNAIFRNSSHPIAVSLVVTTDGGKTWSVDTSQHQEFSNLKNPGGEHLWGVIANTRTIAFSPDNGKTWSYDSLTFKDEPIWLMYWKDTTQGIILTYKDSTIRQYRWRPSVNSVEGGRVFFTVQDLKVYPSIASEFINLVARIPLKGTFEIYDILGRGYASKDVQWSANQTEKIFVDNLPAGVYMAVVKTQRDISSVRFIKE